MSNKILEMRDSYKPRASSQSYLGISIVVLLHILLGWALISGTASHAVTLLMKPMEAVLIQEVTIAPPPPLPRPPPPPKVNKSVVSKPSTPPVPYVPAPEVQVPSTLVAQIETSTAPPPPVMAIPSPQPVAPKPAAPARIDMAIVCPTQVPPEMPRKALLEGIQGVVKAQATIQDGIVKDVAILSGPRIFQAAVTKAMLQYKCTVGSTQVVAVQEFNFAIR